MRQYFACSRFHTRDGNRDTSGTPGMNAPPWRLDTPAPAISRDPRAESVDCAAARVLSAVGASSKRMSSGALSATNVPRPVADDT